MNTDLNNSIDEELVLLLKTKPEKGVALLYDNYSTALLGVLLKIIDNEEVAEDLLQEVFVKIWKNISTYDRSKGRLFTWMLNITRNTGIDHLRSKAHQKSEKIQRIDKSVYTINKNHNVSNNVDTIGLKKFIEELKSDHQIIIDMIYFKGYTQAEVAEELNMPLGTVKTKVKMAIEQLRKITGLGR